LTTLVGASLRLVSAQIILSLEMPKFFLKHFFLKILEEQIFVMEN
jgi:hypothetical protein